MADLNQDVLLALLAAITKALPRATLSTELGSWAEAAEGSLAGHLRTRGILDEELIRALEGLVSSHLRNHGGNLAASLAAWDAHGLTREILTDIESTAAGNTLGATLAESLEATLPMDASAESADGGQARLRNSLEERFDLIRPHASGGIGQVWVARDRELQREVALKEIQPRYAGRADQRARFLLEAEITGNLEHPGIVPVYSLGANAEGRPYYAMRFIRGESLLTAIRRFHKDRRPEQTARAEKRPGSAWGVEFQQLLRRFLDVCDAIDYAHSRGIIHRDLKPGNIMLGPYGETLVVDWGLAKIVGKGDIVAPQGEHPPDDLFEHGYTPGSTQTGGETQPGTTIGTPSYMSPEQARGDLERLGPASDVYSLGATLYELICGVCPFHGLKAVEIIARVKEGGPKPPREILPSIPPELEAICLKAMAFAPADRYLSARELALDVEHWIADEPVAASPERYLQRLSRWLRHHRTWTYAGAASLVGITAVATVALFVVDGARRDEKQARKEAESNYQIAQQAADDLLTNMSENTLFKEQDTFDLRSLRKELLSSALPYYLRFVKDRGHDPKSREQLANAYFRLGEITQVIDSEQAALKLYRSAMQIWEDLGRAEPRNLELQARLADTYSALGKLRMSESLPESLDWLNRALRIYERVAAERPLESRSQASLAACCSEIGDCHSRSSDVDRSLEFFKRARETQQRLVARHPDKIEYKKSLAETINRLGYVDFTRRDFPGALKTYQEFQKLCEEILSAVTSGPKPLNLQDLLAKSYYNIAAIYRWQEQAEPSLAAAKEAEKHWQRLVDVHGSVTAYQVDLASAFCARAWAEDRLGRHELALMSADRALGILDRVIKAEPDNLVHLVEKARTLNLKGMIYDDLRQSVPARTNFQEAVSLFERILGRSSGMDERKLELCTSIENVGETYTDEGNPAEGLKHYREALRLRKEVLTAHPGSAGYVGDVVNALVRIGDLESQNGDLSDAGQSYHEARTMLESTPRARSIQGLLAAVLEREGVNLLAMGERDAGIKRLHESADMARPSIRGENPDGRERETLSEVLWQLARLYRAEGQHEKAKALDEERSALWPSPRAAVLVELASGLAARANLVGYGKARISAAGENSRALDRRQAEDCLRLALARGFSDQDKIRTNPDLAPLLERIQSR